MTKIVITARRPIHLGDVQFEAGDQIAEVELAEGVTHWYLADAIRNGFVGEEATDPAAKKEQAKQQAADATAAEEKAAAEKSEQDAKAKAAKAKSAEEKAAKAKAAKAKKK